MLTVFTNKKREGINTFVCAVSLYVAESPKASIKDHELTLPIIPFGIVVYTVLLDNLSRNSCMASLQKFTGASSVRDFSTSE